MCLHRSTQHVLVGMIQTNVCGTVSTVDPRSLRHSKMQPYPLILQNIGRQLRPKKSITKLMTNSNG
jgi:hypothetical protein